MSRLGERFSLEREIGAGGMAQVFLGRDEVLDRPVAIKGLRGGFVGSEIGTRFRREGRTAARLSHPNIVQVYDAGETELDGREASYIVMEYVPGGDLGKLLNEKGSLSEKELARIGADVASGLAHAHEKGIIHRDIKPHNILIDDYGRAKLADFGIARALGTTQATQTGSYLGTASYSSPEQLRGEEITPKSDVYSLGCTLYEAAVGEPPFSGGPIEVASQQLTKLPTLPRARGVALSEPFEALIFACLAKDPADRPDADNLRERLLQISAVASGAVAPASETTRSFAKAAQEFGVASTTSVTRGLGAVARGLRGRAGPAGASERTLATPTQISHQPLRRRRSRRVALGAGAIALLLLALVAVVSTPALLNLDVGKEAEQAVYQPQDTAESPEETTTAPVASEPTPPASAAEKAVYDMYVEESYQNPNRVWPYLSQRLQNEVGSPEQWAKQEQLDRLWYVYFVQMPKAEVSGDTAEVTFQVRENRTGEVRLVSGTWECVNEGGEWKLDRLKNNKTQTL